MGVIKSKMGVIKSKMGTIGSKMGRKFEQKRKAKWVKKKAILVKAYPCPIGVHQNQHDGATFQEAEDKKTCPG